jgi:hypothetical protein
MDAKDAKEDAAANVLEYFRRCGQRSSKCRNSAFTMMPATHP